MLTGTGFLLVQFVLILVIFVCFSWTSLLVNNGINNMGITVIVMRWMILSSANELIVCRQHRICWQDIMCCFLSSLSELLTAACCFSISRLWIAHITYRPNATALSCCSTSQTSPLIIHGGFRRIYYLQYFLRGRKTLTPPQPLTFTNQMTWIWRRQSATDRHWTSCVKVAYISCDLCMANSFRNGFSGKH